MEAILETKAETILQFIRGLRGSLHVTFEEGTWSAWLYDLLQPHVTQVLACNPRKNARTLSDRNGSQWELLRRRITMLLSPNPAVVFFCCFEQLEMAITRTRPASLPERLHLLRGHRLEAARNSDVLTQHVQRVDSANRGRDGQTYRVAQRLFCPYDAVLDRLAVASQALHAESRNSAAVELRQHLLLETTIGRVKTIERHLDGVKWVIVRQHFQMDRRALMSSETNKTNLALRSI